MPFFSIVIPTYNRSHLIVETISSIIKQDFQDFEIVIIDDGSTDNTQQIIRQQFGNNPKINYLRQNNAERGAARNNGIEKAKGRYIIFFDSDDLMKPDHLQVLYDTIKGYPEANFFATKYEFFSKNKTFPSTVSRLQEGFYGIDLVLKGNPFACHFCIKKDPFISPLHFGGEGVGDEVNRFHEDRKYAIMEDWMFLVKNLIHDKIYIIGRSTILVRDHLARSMRSDNQMIIQKRLLATDWINKNVPLVPKQISTLKGYSFYFCAIHSYLDNDLKNGLKFWWKAVNEIGLRKELLMLLPKILIGKNLIEALKNDRN